MKDRYMELVPDQPHGGMSSSVGPRQWSGAREDAEQHQCHHPHSTRNGESGRIHQRCGVVTGYEDGLLLDL